MCCAQLYSLAGTPQHPPNPAALGLVYEGAIGQQNYFEQCRVAFLIDLLPEAGRLGDGQFLELLRRRLLDEKGDLLPRHGDLVHEVVHGLDGDAAHLHNDVAEVEEADAINEAAFNEDNHKMFANRKRRILNNLF
jgi:hypothetical protein